ncbi:hypothetical protein CROQUDRAFT_674859 [Cronartium quercuum f. sp. fusiforme G11]|uniref:Uncharacterized protein n=1 Tax=Cronartium quercuum f. sp. fusiforme G11 TaxID=708437 RepID=A0A9P6N6X8_9BASI|nr:hypothetical protein CROQUDRAFT_674859 [Cronartium quercuum f. sp. fusiforme G11]
MDSIQSWIWSCAQLYLTHTDPSTAILQPSSPIRTGSVQFLRFLSPHRWGCENDPGIWAEATDRSTTILVNIPRLVLAAFEEAQAADTRRISALTFPVFQLGGAQWIWDTPETHPEVERPPKQLCLKLVNELPNKVFKLKAEMPARIPPFNLSGTVPLNTRLAGEKRGLSFLAASRLEWDQERTRLEAKGGTGFGCPLDLRFLAHRPILSLPDESLCF